MNNLVSSVLLISLIFLGSCRERRGDGRVERLTLTGINGTAHYHILNGRVVTVEKEEYMHPAEYFIHVDKDTVRLGTKFIGRFFVFQPKFKINIEEPRMETFEGAFKEPGTESKEFVFPTERLGTFSFKGKLEYDTLVVPFEYKFIVIPR